MLKLRKILLFSFPYYLFLFLCCLLTFGRIVFFHPQSNYDLSCSSIQGVVHKVFVDGDMLQLTIKGKEPVIGTYYFSSFEEKEKMVSALHLGDFVLVKGKLSLPKHNTSPHLFDYRDYLERKGIFYLLEIEDLVKVQNNQDFIYQVREMLSSYLKKNTYTKDYVLAFVMGDVSLLPSSIRSIYQDIGISHLLAISGTQVTFLSGVILSFLKKIKVREISRYVVTIFILSFYLILIEAPPPVLRAYLFFVFSALNQIYYFHIKSLHLFYLVVGSSLLIDPYMIYDLGFQYSYAISFFLILFSPYFQDKGKVKQLLFTSILSFVAALPISLSSVYQVNLLSIFYNLFYIPYVSYLVFPLSIVTSFFPLLDKLYYLFIVLMEKSAELFSSWSFFTFILAKPSFFFVFLYSVFGLLFCYGFCSLKRRYLVPFLATFLFHYFYYDPSFYLLMIDVGQGDSILLHDGKSNILIDTGGKMPFSKEVWKERHIKSNSSISSRTLLPLFKSHGIRKLDLLILTHGDYDHMGEAVDLVNHFKVDKVIFNCGEFNELEQGLIEVLDQKKIPYYSCIKELNIDDHPFFFLQTKEYDNENDNSNVIYTELNGYQFLFMGDASIKTEKEILKKYHLKNIDVLKVGHHGSKTSSSEEFINHIHPKYSIISVGKDNRYAHPNKEALNNLKQSQIYRTDLDGSIKIKLNKNGCKFEIFRP